MILVIHSLVPHLHQEDSNAVEIVDQSFSIDNLFDFITSLFNTDIGDGHLDHFNKSNGLDFNFNSIVAAFVPSNVISIYAFESEYKPTIKLIINYPVEVPILNDIYKNIAVLRGPPILS